MDIKAILKKKLVRIKKEKVVIPCFYGTLLKNRTALITGGSSGIGFSIAQSFINNGACVTIAGRSVNKLEVAKRNLIELCSCPEYMIDVLVIDIADISAMKEKLRNYLERKKIDIFVNNAGVNGGVNFPDTSEEDYDRILETNLKGMYFISQEIAKYMVENKVTGNILNITSSSSLRPGISPYIISKWGGRSLTLGMAKKYLPYNIIVNGLAPASTLTPMLHWHESDDMNLEWSPAKRYAAPEEMGNLAVMLVSDMGKMIVGDTINATGGAGLLTFDDATY